MAKRKLALIFALLIVAALTFSLMPPLLATNDPSAVEGEWVHHNWESCGRTSYDPDTGQYKYVSYIGQTNVNLGNDDYAPYVWDPVAKIAKFADCELRFFNPHFEFWRNGEELTTAKFQLYKKVGKNWDNVPLSFDSLTVNENDEFATATLKLRDKDENKITANIRFGLFHFINLDFEVKVNSEGEYRLEMDNSGLSGDPREIHSGTGIKGLAEREDRIIGVAYEKMYFRWSYDEAPNRLYLHEVEPDGSELSKKTIELGHLSPGKLKFISPDQWGPTVIQAEADDGEEDGRVAGTHAWKTDGYYGDNGLFLGFCDPYDRPFEPAWRWDNITASGTANDGCKIEVWHNDGHTESGTAANAVLAGIDEANPAAWDFDHRPSIRTKTSETIDWNPPAEAENGNNEHDESPEIRTIIQELLNDYTYTGTQAMAFTWYVTGTPANWWRNYDDYGATSPAKLTIVYTPPVVSVTVADGVVAYGTLAPGATQDTVTLSDTQTATNDGNVAEKFQIKSSNAVGGTDWTLGAAQGDNTFTHEFSTNGGSSWTPMTEAGTYYELAGSVPVSGNQTFDLRIGMPTSITDYGEHTITVTILATAA